MRKEENVREEERRKVQLATGKKRNIWCRIATRRKRKKQQRMVQVAANVNPGPNLWRSPITRLC